MGDTFQETIDRKPGDCDFDIQRVCESVIFQNSGDKPTLLRRFDITTDPTKIILTYEMTV